MAVIVKNSPAENTNNGIGFFIGMAILLVVVLLIIFYGIPGMRSMSGTQINVPDKINVNVQTQGSK